MIKINLIPPEIIKKAKIKKIVGLAIPLLIIVAIGFVSYWLYLRWQIIILDGKFRYLEGELKKYEEVVKRLEILKSEKAILESRLNIIKQLLQKRAVAVECVDKFLSLLPEDIWLNNFSIVDTGGTLDITSSMQSLSYFSIADLYEVLSKHNNFKDPTLSAINSSLKENREILSFSMTFKFSPTIQ